MVPNIPSCHYMLLMQPSRRKLSSKTVSHFVYVSNDHCHRVTIQLQSINIIIIIIIIIIINVLAYNIIARPISWKCYGILGKQQNENHRLIREIKLQAWTGPQGPRRFRLPGFQDIRYMKVAKLSALYAPAALNHGENFECLLFH